MRILLSSAAALVLAGCTTAAEQSRYEAQGETKLQQLLAGKSAGSPQECLPAIRTHDMVRVSESTVLFRDGSNRIYRNDLIGSCNGLASPNYTLVTDSRGGGGQLCRGDLARVVDATSGAFVGSCALGQFVPYSRPRG